MVLSGANNKFYSGFVVSEGCHIFIIIPGNFKTQCICDGAQGHQCTVIFINKRFCVCPGNGCAFHSNIQFCCEGCSSHTYCHQSSCDHGNHSFHSSFLLGVQFLLSVYSVGHTSVNQERTDVLDYLLTRNSPAKQTKMPSICLVVMASL